MTTTDIRINRPVKVKIRGSALAHALKRVSPALSKDKAVPIFGCVQIKVSARYAKAGDPEWRRDLTFEASDRYVAARQVVTGADDIDAGSEDSDVAVVVPYALLPKVDARAVYQLTVRDTGLTVTDIIGRPDIFIPAFDGVYPQLDGLYVEPLEGEHVLPTDLQFDSKMLGQLSRMAYGRGEAVRLSHTSPGMTPRALVVTIPRDEDFVAMAMPQRFVPRAA